MSTLKVTTLQNLSGVEVYTAKAWVNFNGTGTVAIRASGNVSSITDGGVGIYTVNFTTAMPDANYSAVKSDDEYNVGGVGSYTTTSILVVSRNTSFVLADATYVSVSVFR